MKLFWWKQYNYNFRNCTTYTHFEKLPLVSWISNSHTKIIWESYLVIFQLLPQNLWVDISRLKLQKKEINVWHNDRPKLLKVERYLLTQKMNLFMKHADTYWFKILQIYCISSVASTWFASILSRCLIFLSNVLFQSFCLIVICGLDYACL